MYLDLFRLKELPFRLSPDPQFLYLSSHHARAKAYMESTIWFTDGFVVITGEIGSGKTTLIESFLRELDKDVVVAQINQTQISPLGFLQGLLVQFGFSPFKMNKAELLATVNRFLIEQYAAGRKVVLVIDEAQNLSQRVLEEVRLLSGVETTKDKTLRIILAGQPELGDKLDSPEMVQLAQRIRLRFHLTPLSREDCTAYILHRLEVAGAEGRAIFSDAALALVQRYAGGVPRLINTLCDTAMMSAFAIDKDTVDEAEVKAAIDELQWVEYAARTNRMARAEMVVPVLRHVTPETVLGRLYVATDGRTVSEKELRLGRLLVGRLLHVALLHLAAAGDQVHEDPQERDDDDEDAPQRLDPAVEVVAAEDVREHHDQQPDPDDEEEEPQHRQEQVCHRVVSTEHRGHSSGP